MRHVGGAARHGWLRTDVPLAERLADLEWHGARRDALEPLLARIGALALADRVPRWL